MVDIATLGLRVDSTGALKAASDLDTLTGKAATAEQGAKGLEGASKTTSAALTGAGTAASKTALAYQSSGTAARVMGRQSQLAAGSVSNLTAQFNDIGVMLAAGQSPLQLAIQQGTQISQVFGNQSAGAAVRGLGAAFMSMLSPLNLLTIGTIAGGAALVQWGMRAAGAGEEAEEAGEAVDLLTDALGRYETFADTATRSTLALREEWGQFSDDIRETASFMARVSMTEAVSALGGATEPMRASIAAVDEYLTKAAEARSQLETVRQMQAQGLANSTDVLNAEENLTQFRDLAAEAADAIGLTVLETLELEGALNALGKAEGAEEMAKRAANALLTIESFEDATGRIPPNLVEVANYLRDLQEQASLAALASGDMEDDDIASGLRKAANEAERMAKNITKAFEDAQSLSNLSLEAFASSIGMGGIYGPQTGVPDWVGDLMGSPSFQINANASRAQGLREGDAGLREFLRAGGVSIDPEKTEWCAAFLNAVMSQSGIQGTGKLNAKSYLNWGDDVGGVENARKGDVVVFDRGEPGSWQGHVGLYQGRNEDGTVNILGGNQSDGVNTRAYSTDRIEGVRRATGEENQFDSEGYSQAVTASEELERANAASLKTYNRLVGSMDEARKASLDYAEAQAVIDEALKRGQITQAEATDARSQAEAEYGETLEAIRQKSQDELDQISQSVSSLQGSWEPAIAAANEYAKAQETISEALDKQQISQEQATRLMSQAREQYEQDIADIAEKGRSQFDGLVASYDDAAAAAQEFARAQEVVKEALDQGHISAGEAAQAIALARQEYQQTMADIAEEAAKLEDNAKRGADAMTDLFMSITQGADSARDAIAQLLMQIATGFVTRGFEGLAASGVGGGFFSGLGGLLDFDGGGYTGSGSRSGGVDGKGGFPAILHPQETVVDHTKGQGLGPQSVDVRLVGGDLVLSDSGQIMTNVSARIERSASATEQRTLAKVPGRLSERRDRMGYG